MPAGKPFLRLIKPLLMNKKLQRNNGKKKSERHTKKTVSDESSGADVAISIPNNTDAINPIVRINAPKGNGDFRARKNAVMRSRMTIPNMYTSLNTYISFSESGSEIYWGTFNSSISAKTTSVVSKPAKAIKYMSSFLPVLNSFIEVISATRTSCMEELQQHM